MEPDSRGYHWGVPRGGTVNGRCPVPCCKQRHVARATPLAAILPAEQERRERFLAAARLAGHSDSGTTSRVYAHEMTEDPERTVAIGDGLLRLSTLSWNTCRMWPRPKSSGMPVCGPAAQATKSLSSI